jgi:hypothetical protein
MGTHAETHQATIDLLSHNNGSILKTRNAYETGVTGNKLHMRISQNGKKKTSKKCTISHTEEMQELFILLLMHEKGRYRRIHT